MLSLLSIVWSHMDRPIGKSAFSVVYCLVTLGSTNRKECLPPSSIGCLLTKCPRCLSCLVTYENVFSDFLNVLNVLLLPVWKLQEDS